MYFCYALCVQRVLDSCAQASMFLNVSLILLQLGAHVNGIAVDSMEVLMIIPED
jgi:hypothetical protein